jgi:signal recognition particle receptor subunit beta
MAYINHALRRLVAKVVYFGPGLSGKTTNILALHHMLQAKRRSEVISHATKTGRTLLLDLLTVEMPDLAGYRTSLHLFAAPGLNYYDKQRRLMLKGLDGLVFVADSQKLMQLANQESLRSARTELAEAGAALDDLPTVVQYNKRDLPAILPMRELNSLLERPDWPWFEAVAVAPSGVLETFRAIADATFHRIEKDLLRAGPPPLEGWLILQPGQDGTPGPSWLPAEISDPFARLLSL